MKLSVLAMAGLLSLGLALPMHATAKDSELGKPIVALMPHVKKLGPALELNTEQQKALAAWTAEAPKKRKVLEGETIALREQMREAILTGASRLEREQIKKELAAKQTRLIEMRALCTRMLRKTLTAEQFARVVESYRAG